MNFLKPQCFYKSNLHLRVRVCLDGSQTFWQFLNFHNQMLYNAFCNCSKMLEKFELKFLRFISQCGALNIYISLKIQQSLVKYLENSNHI